METSTSRPAGRAHKPLRAQLASAQLMHQPGLGFVGQALSWLVMGVNSRPRAAGPSGRGEVTPHEVRDLAQMRLVVSGLCRLRLPVPVEETDRYRWIETALERVAYAQLARGERGTVLSYLQCLSGYSRAQLTRLVARWTEGQPLVKRHVVPGHAFGSVYTGDDRALLGDVDRQLSRLPGPVTAELLRRARDVHGDDRFARLGSISVARLYELRQSLAAAPQGPKPLPLRPASELAVAVRSLPPPDDRPGHLRIEWVPRMWPGFDAGLCFRAVDGATQWQIVATVDSEDDAGALWAALSRQFPFVLLSVTADAGAPAIAGRMTRRLQALRASACTPMWPDADSADAPHERFLRRVFNPFINGHLPCRAAGGPTSGQRQARPAHGVMTPLDRLACRADAAEHLLPGVSLAALQADARRHSDLQAADRLVRLRAALVAAPRARSLDA